MQPEPCSRVRVSSSAAARHRTTLASCSGKNLRRSVRHVHTNLGRAPLADEALAHVVAAARGYSNLEYDIPAGARGSRQTHVAELLQRLTGAEAALVVNNNAAAVMLALAALAEGREVVVSRGELIEIGDGFRIPDVLARSGARLREVGTTTRLCCCACTSRTSAPSASPSSRRSPTSHASHGATSSSWSTTWAQAR